MLNGSTNISALVRKDPVAGPQFGAPRVGGSSITLRAALYIKPSHLLKCFRSGIILICYRPITYIYTGEIYEQTFCQAYAAG